MITRSKERKDDKFLKEALELIILNLNRIYAHLEVDWDSYSEEELLRKYQHLREIELELKRKEPL